MSLESLADHTFQPVAEAIEAGRIPGAALGIATADGQRAIRWGGVATLLPEAEPLARDTMFDLASLTKVMVTVVEILRLVEDGLADLDDPLAKHLPDASPDQAGQSLRALLTHSSGLPAHEKIWGWGSSAEERRALIIRRGWRAGAPVYSDINYMLLGFVIEARRGMPLAALPLPPGLTFRPAPAAGEPGPGEAGHFAATETCMLRGRLLRGEVHDENAWSLGGAAGHAGLFGSARALIEFALDILRGRLLSPAALAEMTRPQTADRALGWERRHPHWKGGSLCSERTIGHLGFTGTGLWIDLERGIAWTLLTNRVHPRRDRETGIQDLRRAVGNRLASRWRGLRTTNDRAM